MRTHLVGTVLLLVLAGCAAAETTAGEGLTRPADLMVTSTGEIVRPSTLPAATAVIDAAPDDVWRRVPTVYGELGIGGEILDLRGRTYGNQRFTQAQIAGRRTADFVRCGYGAGPSSSAQQRIRLSIVSRVLPEDGGRARLVTEVSGTAASVSGVSNDPVPCVSSGEIESRIHRMLAELLARSANP